jgi:hypothetical protein
LNSRDLAALSLKLVATGCALSGWQRRESLRISGEDDHLDFLDSKILMYPNFD